MGAKGYQPRALANFSNCSPSAGGEDAIYINENGLKFVAVWLVLRMGLARVLEEDVIMYI